jgi:hypothetical protein
VNLGKDGQVEQDPTLCDARSPSTNHHERMGPLCGVDHRQHAGRCATTRSFLEMHMPDSESDQKRDLECLRLASDLVQLASATLNPELKAHCHRMAGILNDQVKQGPGR